MIKISLFSSVIALTVAMAPSHATLRLEEGPYKYPKSTFRTPYVNTTFLGQPKKNFAQIRKEKDEAKVFKRAFDHSKVEAPLLSSTEKTLLLASAKKKFFSESIESRDDQEIVALLESSSQTPSKNLEDSAPLTSSSAPLIKINLPKKTRHVRGFNNTTEKNLVVESTERLSEILQGGYKALSPRGKKAAFNISQDTKVDLFESEGKDGIDKAEFLAKHTGLKSAQNMLTKLDEATQAKGKVTAIEKRIQGLERSLFQLEVQQETLQKDLIQSSKSYNTVNNYYPQKQSSPSPNIRAPRHLDSSIKGSSEYNRARRILLDNPESKEVVSLYKQALKKNPELVEAHLELALLYIHREQYQEADQAFEGAVSASTLKDGQEGRLSFNDFRPVIVAQYHYGTRLMSKADEALREGRRLEAAKYRDKAIAFLDSAHKEGYAYATQTLYSYFKNKKNKIEARLSVVEKKIIRANTQLKQAKAVKSSSEKIASQKQQKFDHKYTPIVNAIKGRPPMKLKPLLNKGQSA